MNNEDPWSRDLFGALATSPHIALMVICRGRIVLANPAVAHLSGYPLYDLFRLPARGFLALAHPVDRARVRKAYEARIRGDPVAEPYTVRILHQTDGYRWVSVYGVSSRYHGAPAAVALLVDVTDREEAHERHRRSEAAMERAQAIAAIGSYTWHLRAGRIEWTPVMYHLYGVPAGDPIPTKEELDRRCDPADRPRLERAIRATMRTGAPMEVAFRLQGGDGVLRYVLARGERRRATPPERGWMLDGTLQDITAQRRLEQQVVESSQREQQRIGADIHDSLGQELAAISMMAGALEAHIRRACPALTGATAKLAEVARRGVRHARALAHGLTPIDIAQLGLEVELQRLAEESAALFNVDLRFRARVDHPLRDTERETHLYYIAKEALTNALRHGRPGRIRLELTVGVRRGRLSIRDNGQWTAEALDGSGAGLRIMQHRADLIGGHLRIAHSRRTGTAIVCEFPVR